MTGRAVRRAAPLVAFAALGCDPVIDVFGSFFPAWVICLAAGVALTALARQLFALVRLEPHLGPLILIYPSLGLLFTLTVWLLFFRT